MPRRRGTFRARLDVHARTIGEGPLLGRYAVDQRYAAYQHVHETLNHPRGGGPDFVSAPLKARHRAWFRRIAARFLSGQAPIAMAEAMEDLDSQVSRLAPIETGDLRGSGSVTVLSGASVVYLRPARVARRDR